MENSSISSKVSDQIIMDQKENPKKDSKVAFSNSVDIVQYNQFSKEIEPEPLNNNYSYNNNPLNLKYSGNLDNKESDRRAKRLSKRSSMKHKMGKNLAEFKRKNDLSTIKEIVIGDNNERIISNNPKKRFAFKGDEEEGKKKKKINIIEELIKFDREQQIKMEEYLEKKRRQQIEYLFKSSKLYKIINSEDSKDDKSKGNKSKENEDSEESQEDDQSDKDEKSNESKEEQKNNKDDNNKKEQNNDNKNDNKNDNDKEKVKNKKKGVKDKNNKNGKNKYNNENNNFQKVKEKYYCQNIYKAIFPHTEYKIKYLDNYLKNDSLRKNLFSNYVYENEESNKKNVHNNIKFNINSNTNNNNINNNNPNNANNNSNIKNSPNNVNNNTIINNNPNSINSYTNNNNISANNINNNNSNNSNNATFYHNLYKTPSSQKRNIINRYNSNDLKSKNNNIVSMDTTNTIIDSNNKYNNKTEQSINSNTYSINSNRIYKKHNSFDQFDNAYKMIIDSIDDKLYNKYKYNNKSILSGSKNNNIYSSSIDKINIFSNTDYKNSKNTFRDSALNSKNRKSYYKDICDKYDKYNGLKMTTHFSRNSKYNSNNYFNKDYKIMRMINGLNGVKKYVL